MRIPKAISELIDSFEKLPGIGPKSAQRLTFYLLHVPQKQLDDFAQALENLKRNTVMCSICHNISDMDPCTVCSDRNRDDTIIMVVEQPLDILAFERTGKYSGVYHVLHGAINPLDNIGPDEIFIPQLINRVIDNANNVTEVIIATNPTMEGDATAMYIKRKFSELNNGNTGPLVTRLGMGIPTGADVEYADETTLTQAIQGRREI